jgi:hypothetical protein
MYNRYFPGAFFTLMFVTLFAGFGLATETTYKMRECLANGNSQAECELKHYGR